VASGDIKLVSSSANKIKVRVSEYKERPEIPIRISYEGALAEGFVRDPAVTSLESLSVSGPAEEVERILYARVRVDLKDTKVSLDEELPYELVSKDDEILTMSDYVTINEPTVRVMVPVFFYKQIKLELDIVEGAGAKKENVSFTIDPPVIGVVGDEATLRAMDDTLVIRQFRLAEITETVDLTVIPELPGGVINRGTDNSVVIHLELVDLFTKTFYISPADIHRENDNGTLDFGVSRIPVIVRGNAKQIISLTADMLSVSADMTNDYDDTTKTVKLKVLLPVQSGCGVLGEYSVPVVEKIPETVPDETTGEG
jgi:YbbR domain-containing protein